MNNEEPEKRKENLQMEKPKVFIAIPTTGNIRTELAMFLLTLDKNSHNVIVSYTCGGGITHNRNKLTGYFLRSKFEWLLFLDSDTVPPMNVLDMIKNGKNICSGVYHQFKDGQVRPLTFEKVKSKYGYVSKEKDDYLVEVDAVGAGCLLINRKVFEKMKKPYFIFLYDKDGLLKLSEDLNFCKKAQKAGFKIWVGKRIGSSHYKTVNLSLIWKNKMEKEGGN